MMKRYKTSTLLHYNWKAFAVSVQFSQRSEYLLQSTYIWDKAANKE